MWGALFVLVLSVAAIVSLDEWIKRTELPSLTQSVSTIVVDRNGQLLRAYTQENGLWRLKVDITEVDNGYIDQLIAFEDKRFYRHAGVDPIALVRAIWQAARHGEIVSGGSTLTMQVARLLEDGTTGRWNGKLRQMRLALALERHLEKDEILELYLTLAPFGGNLEGARAASLSYFGKEPQRLTAAQSALLVALPQAPETRRPDRFPMAARTARDRVLNRSRKNGALSANEVLAALSEPTPAQRRPFPAYAPHLADRILREGPLEGRYQLTLDRDIQEPLERLIKDHVTRLDPHLSAALMVVDAKSGEVIAAIGSPDYTNRQRQGFVDMTRAKRSPGSTLKPLIYGLAFDQGIAHPESLIDDRPVDFGGYAPENFDRRYRGPVFVREALQSSLNVPAVILLDQVGPAHLMSAMRQARAAPALPNGSTAGLAIGLGGVGLSLWDMAQLYQALANQGVSKPITYRFDPPAQQERRILSARSAWYVTDILKDVPSPSNSTKGKIALKTGTSYGHRDVWTVGYDGRYVIAVWLGRPDATPIPGALGLNLATPVLFEAFGRVALTPTPLSAPPSNALIVSNAQLPLPLRTVKTPWGQRAADNAPKIIYPPSGARIELATADAEIPIKLRDGMPPFTWIINGQPQKSETYDRVFSWQPKDRGFFNLSVIDRLGQATNQTIFLD